MRVRYFAAARELAGTEYDDIEIEGPLGLEGLREVIAGRRPALAALLARCRFARDDEFVPEQAQVANDQTIDVIPPVAGG